MEKLYPQLAASGSGRGATMEPLWQLLNSKTNSEQWNPDFRGCLRSAFAGRQYPQTRVMAAGWADHNKCISCLSAIVDSETANLSEGEKEKRTMRHPVVASPEQILKAPVGNLNHRIWTGACLHEDRCSHAPPVDVAVANHHDTSGNPAWERALVPRPPLPKKGKHRNDTFFWDVKPTSPMMEGTFYMDGSCFESNIA